MQNYNIFNFKTVNLIDSVGCGSSLALFFSISFLDLTYRQISYRTNSHEMTHHDDSYGIARTAHFLLTESTPMM